jgi:hypothetical protein
MITSFPTPDPENIGGCQMFWFIPSNQVMHLPVTAQRKILSPIVLKANAAFLLGYATEKTLFFDEKPQENDAGDYYMTEVGGFFPKMTPGTLALFSSMRKQRFIVVVEDNNGHKRVAGSLDNPMKFSFDASTGDNPKSRNGYRFMFKCQSIHESPFLLVMH